MWKKSLRWLTLALIVTLAACGPTPGGSGTSGATAPTATGRPAATLPMVVMPTPVPTTAPPPAVTATRPPPTAPAPPLANPPPVAATKPVVDAGLARAIANAQADLVRRFGPTALGATVVQAEAVEWPDGSLGCPQPGMMYPQVITPGYKVVLESGGQTYVYHGDRSGNMKLCETGAGAAPTQAPNRGGSGGGAAAGSLDAQIAAAKTDLIQRTPTLKAEDIRLVSAESVEWRDGSLGCPKPGMMYTMALVPGYQIILEAGGKTYDYHGATGRPPVLCEPSGGVRPRPALPGGAPGTPAAPSQ